MRFIIFLIAIGLVVFIIKKSLKQLIKPNQAHHTQSQESMVPCLYCQTHVPASEALHHVDKTFCSKEHLDAWLKENNAS